MPVLPDVGQVPSSTQEEELVLTSGKKLGVLSVIMRVCLVTVTLFGFGIVRVVPESVMLFEADSSISVSVAVSSSVCVDSSIEMIDHSKSSSAVVVGRVMVLVIMPVLVFCSLSVMNSAKDVSMSRKMQRPPEMHGS